VFRANVFGLLAVTPRGAAGYAGTEVRPHPERELRRRIRPGPRLGHLRGHQVRRWGDCCPKRCAPR
jgi:hypothetical protein